MGQLVALEHELKEKSGRVLKDVSDFIPSDEQEQLTEMFQHENMTGGGSNDNTPSPKEKQSPPGTAGSGSGGMFGTGKSSPFVLKLPMGRNKKGKKTACVGGEDGGREGGEGEREREREGERREREIEGGPYFSHKN